jgi:hypothetical protein
LQAYFDLDGAAMAPRHWGMFDLSMHGWHEPVERVTHEAEKRGVKLIVPRN